MSIKSQVRKAALSWGVEINRFNPIQSPQARFQRQLAVNGVDLVIDVGANDGGYAKLIRESGFSGNILSFEPLANAHERLCTFARSDEQWHVAARMALGDKNDKTEINVSENSTSSSLLPMLEAHVAAAPKSQYQSVETIDVRRLDGIEHPVIAKSSRLFVKLDVQGFEMAVLRGSLGLLDRIYGFQVECSLVELYQGQELYPCVFEWMSSQGFDLWGVVPGFSDEASGRMLQMDGIFFRGNV